MGEGRPATWDRNTVETLAGWGDPDAMAQMQNRLPGGVGRAPLKFSTVESNPRSVTRFGPEGEALGPQRNSLPWEKSQTPATPPDMPQGNPTSYAGPERRTSSASEREIFKKMINNPEGEQLGQSIRQAREGSGGAESEGPARMAIMRSPDYPRFRAAELAGDTATMREMLVNAKKTLPPWVK